MQRRTVIILSLVSAFISLIYMLLSYFGFTRYFALHMFPIESYTKNYAKLDKASDKKVVISLTTTPKGIKKLKPVINSLLDQTVKVDEIAISVPYGKQYDIPKDIQNVAQVYRYSLDYGNNGKLIPIVLREGEKDTKIIIVDDDMIYGKDFIETMITASEENKNTAICAKNSVLITPEFFTEDVCNYDGKSTCDEWLKKNLKVPYKAIEYTETYKCI